MRLGKSILIAVLCISASALAEIRTLVSAVETDPAYLHVPTTTNSRLSFKLCADCETMVARLTPMTTYSLNGDALDFADFRRKMNNRRKRSDGYALVLIDTKTNTVRSIEVTS